MDSIIYDSDILMSAIAFSGADKIVLGSDHPHQIGDLANAVDRVRKLEISEDEKDMVLWKNAKELLKI